jgi:hypothetical protein
MVSAFHQAMLDVIVRAPWIASAVRPWILFWGVLFTAGAMTRVSFALLTIGALPWAVLYTTQVGHHTISALMLTLLFMQGAHWGDAVSIDAWRRGQPDRRSAREYGFVVWAPGFVLGLTLLAAAVAKLRESGIAWILNGTVKYHFLSDAGQALVTWGIYVGRYPWAAVFLSFVAIAIESLVIVGVLSKQYRYRLLAGLAAMSLLIGFMVFQGILWPAWWMLLLSFLPWHLIRPQGASANSSREQIVTLRAPAIAITAVIAVQLFISAFKLEIAPVFSTYDMYSTTYGNAEEYASKAGMAYWLIAERTDGTTNECRVSRTAADTISRAIANPALWRTATSVLDGCFDSSAIARVSVQGRRASIDWSRQSPAAVATVPLAGPSAITPN